MRKNMNCSITLTREELYVQVWATSEADRLDPLAKSPPSNLDGKKKWGSYWSW